MTKPIHTYVHTLGDSTLDNLYWLINSQGTNLEEAQQNCVEGQLQKELGEGYQVVSHAYDGFTTQDVLNGRRVAQVLLPIRGADVQYQTYLDEKKQRATLFTEKNGEQFYLAEPFNELSEDVRKSSNAVHYVVLSVGGNDFRENLQYPVEFFKSLPLIQNRYLEIARRVNKLSKDVRLILVFQYLPSTSEAPYYIHTGLGIGNLLVAAIWGLALSCLVVIGMRVQAKKIQALAIPGILCLASLISLAIVYQYVPFSMTLRFLKLQRPGLAALGALMEKFYLPMLQYAYENYLPILDLANSLNPFDHNLYISAIEPSQEGGQRIAHGLANIIRGYTDQNGTLVPSHQYISSAMYQTNDQLSLHVPNQWTVKYPRKIQ